MARRTKHIPFKSKPVYAIVVDGDCESWYMNMLKRNEKSIRVDIKPEIPQRKKLKTQYERVKELAEQYDHVIWIIDFDVVNSQTLTSRKSAKSPLKEFEEYCTGLQKIKNISVIVNAPCLEYWFLLHFERTSRYYNKCEGAVKQLKKYLPDYEKTRKTTPVKTMTFTLN